MSPAVYVQTNDATGNEVIAFSRTEEGALAPLQDGILFHYLMQQHGDLYLMAGVFGFASKPRLFGFTSG